ncbi:MAG TPA: Gfo/Idh/MocA family oxidoreductase [Candidatus Hydrogenedentes bacterium]|nr:Gfo/Idh/MocA family oxidoreductase [Candidatus Hydrogenedentota bacterium]HPG65790.1 Gfo/Idh/MocA family oxidoreductase [Candidatus Hydrogenedentota bacterium]
MEVSRRRFLGSSAAAVVAAGTMAKGKVFGANDKVRICNIGIHGQGGSHINDLLETEGFEVVALCDVDQRVLDSRVKEVEKKSGKAPKAYRDARDVMADDSIDAITIATPNHWHSLLAIWGCQAGKDVYVEKPLSHNVWEGRQLANAMKKYERIVMHGTQSRSSSRWQRDIKLMRDGIIGRINMAKGFTYKTGNRMSIGVKPNEDPPEGLDWNLWQGPAQEQPFCKNYVHYNWHWFWIYGNGEIGNQGVHQMDVAVWGLGKDGQLPVQAYSSGGRYAWEDQAETPNTQTTTFTYDDGTMMVFEVRNLGSYQEAGQTTGNHFLGDTGYYVQDQGFFDYRKNEPIPIPDGTEEPPGRSKWENFLNAIKSRKLEDCPCDGNIGHYSAAHCHIGNVAYRLKRSLNFDPKTERFVGDDEANAMLTRAYREPFVVPEIA